jgi:hypothetical protein
MDDVIYEAYVCACENKPLAQSFQGPQNKNVRGNILRQIHKYKIENGKLWYNYGKRKNRKKVEDFWLQIVRKVCNNASRH